MVRKVSSLEGTPQIKSHRYPTPKLLTFKLKLTHRSCHFGLRVGMILSSGLKLHIVFN